MDKSADKSALPQNEVLIDDIEGKNIETFIPSEQVAKLREDVQMVEALCPAFDEQAYLKGGMTPVFFGSAINNFGVKELLEGLMQMAPSPRAQKVEGKEILPTDEKVSGFVFKIQANMDPKHRDRIAFMRVCSGHFKRGMKLLHIRSDKQLVLHNPVLFLAQERELAEDAYAGDIIGIPNHGNLRIGDTLTEGERFNFSGIPSFAPELLQKARPVDPLKAKHLGKALMQLAEEGAATVVKPLIGSDWIVGVVGALQFQILADRIRTEYDVPVIFEPTSFVSARWVEGDSNAVKDFTEKNRGNVGTDNEGDWVFLARNDWHLNKTQEDYPKIKMLTTKQH